MGNAMRTRRIPTVSLSWHKSFNKRSRLTRSRLKKPKKLLLSILPNTEKLNKNLKKLRIDPEWPREHYPLPVNPLDSCKRLELNSSKSYANRTNIVLVETSNCYKIIC